MNRWRRGTRVLVLCTVVVACWTDDLHAKLFFMRRTHRHRECLTNDPTAITWANRGLFERVDYDKGVAYALLVPRSYNYTLPLMVRTRERDFWGHFFADVAFSSYDTRTAYDCRGRCVPLAENLWGRCLFLGDIFLASALAKNGKLTLPGTCPSFGSLCSEQFIASLASTELFLSARTKVEKWFFDCAFHGQLPTCTPLAVLLGVNLAARTADSDVALTTRGGSLGTGSSLGENNLHQFFNTFNIDLVDFLRRAVLEPKGLSLCEHRRSGGLRTLTVYASVGYSPQDSHVQCTTLGCAVRAGIGRCRHDTSIWQFRDDRRSTAFKAFFHVVGKTEHSWLNPFAYLALTVFARAPYIERVAQFKNEKSALFTPAAFDLHEVLPFRSWDVTSRRFADEAIPVMIRRGPAFTILAANAWEHIFRSPFSCSLAYRFRVHGHDNVEGLENPPWRTFDTDALVRESWKVQHSIFFNVALYRGDRLSVNLGAQSVVGARNCAAYNKFFVISSMFF